MKKKSYTVRYAAFKPLKKGSKCREKMLMPTFLKNIASGYCLAYKGITTDFGSKGLCKMSLHAWWAVRSLEEKISVVFSLVYNLLTKWGV